MQKSLCKWESFKNLLCELHGDKFSFDFIGVTEVFECSKDKRLHLTGYHDIITRTRDDSNRGGVGLFISNNISFTIREDLSVFIPHIYESLFIEVKSSNKHMNTQIVGVIYRPNSQPRADIDIFSTTLHEVMDVINSEGKSCILLGDFNIDLLQYSKNEKTNDYIDNIFARGFVPLILKPTRITRSTATLIDHIYSNQLSKNSQSGIVINDVADHFGIYHIVHSKPKPTLNEKIGKRIFSEVNINKFNNLLSESNFVLTIEENCSDRSYDKFIALYTDTFDAAFPIEYFPA